MEQVFNDYLTKESNRLPHIELRLKKIALPKAYKVPQGRIQHQVIPAKTRVIGSRRLTLLTRVDGQTVSNQSVRVELEAMAEIAIVSSAMRRGKILNEQDVELRYQDISKIKNPIFDLSTIIGKRLKRSVRLGDPLQANQVEFPPVIKRGERVVIQVESQGLMLSAAGEAKQDGQTGETIQVMNTNSRKQIRCQVVAPGLVKVEL
jgi:flagellar basal body P-ring formation protein FlgA